MFTYFYIEIIFLRKKQQQKDVEFGSHRWPFLDYNKPIAHRTLICLCFKNFSNLVSHEENKRRKS